MSFDYKVRDLSLAEAGRHQIRLAEHEMPGLMALREEYAAAQPLKGARIAGSLHMTVQTAVLIETLIALGAEVRWASCNIFSTQDQAAAAVVVGPNGTPDDPQGVPVFAWKGETLAEYWWCTEQILTWPGGEGPNMILDDGGDATLLVHKGREFEKAGAVPSTTEDDSEEYAVILETVRNTLKTDPQKWTTDRGRHQGRHRGDHDRCAPALPAGRGRQAAVPGDQRQRLGHQVQVRQQVRLPPLPDRRHQPRHRRADRRQGRRRLRLRRRRQGLRRVAARPGRPRDHHRDRPDLRAAGGDGRLPGRPLEDVVETADIFVTTTGCFDVITADHMRRMKHQAIVGNIGHFDNEIDMAGLAKTPGITKTEIKPQVHEWTFADGSSIIVLSEGRLLNLGNATGHPSFVMSNSFANQTIAQIELFTKPERVRQPASTCCPSTWTRRSPGCTSTRSASSSPS